MRKKWFVLLVAAGTALCMAGCEKQYTTIDELQRQEAEKEVQEGTEEEPAQLQTLPKDTSDIAVLEMRYGEDVPYPELSAFLAEYFAVPEEQLAETRYYYNYIDLNEDGADEIVAAVTSEELEEASGHPILILEADTRGGFTVLTLLEEVHTPVVIDDAQTDGWHNVIPAVYGGMTSPGFLIYHYGENGYQAGEEDFVETLQGISGVQILSDNFIDDLDRGDYLTLQPETGEEE